MTKRAASSPASRRKVALVTGAGVRLGRAIALGLGRAGYDVVLHYNKSKAGVTETARELQALGARTAALRADLSSGKAATKLARDADAALGPVALLVNSAAIFWPTTLEKLDERAFDAFMNVNLKAPYLLSAELGRRMKARGSGNIVNIACVSGLRAWRTYVPYSISKAGVISLTVGMAKLLGPEVRVNAIAPGTVLAPEGTSPEELQRLAHHVPLKKIGQPDDIVAAVLYLCSATFVTGQVVCVDGGRSIV